MREASLRPFACSVGTSQPGLFWIKSYKEQMVVGYNSEGLDKFTIDAQHMIPSVVAPSGTEPQNEKSLGRVAKHICSNGPLFVLQTKWNCFFERSSSPADSTCMFLPMA